MEFDDRFLMKRLKKLEQSTIINYYHEVNLSKDGSNDNSIELYEVMFQHLLNGDFDDIFPSKYLIGMDLEEKNEIFRLALKYSFLCFYHGDPSYWIDSIDGVSLSDIDLVSIKLLDNFDYLLSLSKVGGENLLEQLAQIQKCENYSNSSLIDQLRNRFLDDDILRNVLLELPKKDSVFSGLTFSKKGILLNYPLGTLYYEDEEGKYHISQDDSFVKEISFKVFGDEDRNIHPLKEVSRVLSDGEFEEMISDISSRYISSPLKLKK